MTAPGTRPPPSTRSSSSTPVGRNAAVVASTSAIRRAGSTTVVAAVVRATAVPVSSTVPHAWHSPQRPTHLTVVQPHSAHLYAGALEAREVFVAMRSTLAAAPDNSRPPAPTVPAARPWLRPRPCPSPRAGPPSAAGTASPRFRPPAAAPPTAWGAGAGRFRSGRGGQ